MEYTYNRQGERTTKKGQNETVHAFDYDLLGRPIEDRVTAVGTGVDDAVRRIATRYTVRGQVETITSYDDPAVATGTVLNQVQYLYNAFNQLIADYQNHSGAVDMVTTPKVAYTYSDGSSGHVRPTQLVYPNGRLLRYEYNTGTDDALGRASFLADDDSGAVGTHLAEYAYLGLGQFVQVTYPEPNLRYDLAHGTGDDPYDGLDRFDRIVDLVWRNQTQSIDVERIQHGYDRAGSRLWRETPVAAANGVHLDELYAYDGMNQLVTFARGDLNAAKNGLLAGTKSLAQQWSLDATGNWSGFQEDSDGDDTWDLAQSRSHNRANEITQIAASNDHVAHDRVGNMIRTPKPDDWSSHYDLTYDAWNRLAKVTDDGLLLAKFSYDSTGRRIEQLTEFVDGQPQKATHYFHSGQQVIETREGCLVFNPESLSPKYQNVWSLRYIDSLILRDEYSSGVIQSASRLFYLSDVNYNVTTVVGQVDVDSGSEWQVLERTAYSAYGKTTIYIPDWSATRTSSHVNNTTLYTGRELDLVTGLYYYRARYYGAELGRFVGRDPIGYAALCPNLYEYVGSSPGIRTDPSGLQFVPGLTWLTSAETAANTATAGMADFLKTRCDVCDECDKNGCKNDADKIVKALRKMIAYNWGRGNNVSKDSWGGYLCWDWAAKGMAGAIASVNPSYWKAEVKVVVRDYTDGRGPANDHWYIRLTACGKAGDKAVALLDDGYIQDTGYYHEPPWPINAKHRDDVTDWRPFVAPPGQSVIDLLPANYWTTPPIVPVP